MSFHQGMRIVRGMLLAFLVAVLCTQPQSGYAETGLTGLASDREQVDPRTWPEIPIPPQPQKGLHQPDEIYPDLDKRWLMQVGGGWQHNVGPQKEFFTDMVQLNLAVGKPVTEHLLPFVSCELGFGGLEESLEKMTGEGRATSLGVKAGLLGSLDLTKRHRYYASVAAGYFSRSMLWGETYRDPETGESSNGETITMGHWGISLRTGFLFQLSHGTKTRFVDLGVGLQLSPADKLLFQGIGNTMTGSEEDAWLTITLRFWDTL